MRLGDRVGLNSNTAGICINHLPGLSSNVYLSSLTYGLVSCLILLTSENGGWIKGVRWMRWPSRRYFCLRRNVVARCDLGQSVRTGSSGLFRGKGRDLPFNLGSVTPISRCTDLLRLLWPVEKHYHGCHQSRLKDSLLSFASHLQSVEQNAVLRSHKVSSGERNSLVVMKRKIFIHFLSLMSEST